MRFGEGKLHGGRVRVEMEAREPQTPKPGLKDNALSDWGHGSRERARNEANPRKLYALTCLREGRCVQGQAGNEGHEGNHRPSRQTLPITKTARWGKVLAVF